MYFQSESRDWKAAEMSSRDDCKYWRMRGSDLDELLMCLCSFASMRLTKRESRRRTVNELSESLEWRSGRQERASGPVRRWSRTWMIFRSKSAKLSNHHA